MDIKLRLYKNSCKLKFYETIFLLIVRTLEPFSDDHLLFSDRERQTIRLSRHYYHNYELVSFRPNLVPPGTLILIVKYSDYNIDGLHAAKKTTRIFIVVNRSSVSVNRSYFFRGFCSYIPTKRSSLIGFFCVTTKNLRFSDFYCSCAISACTSCHSSCTWVTLTS